ncbi:hypothetical protein Adeg_0624 [Ammonifex degensii KC4]|uniref:Uncharacterized protein n=1 Tax=Ammonifex degensii (strain DSM 10501 / KC4) TaxID=429009 RepID=C9RBZ5_AMMDK|nr:hypothetical protein [Ammonifex degensii]ACX51772.1 hypothetical protein Adeg_0624 [Ammonifex degensii KC4]
MQWHNLRWKVSILTFLLALALLWGGQWFYDRYGFQHSLAEALAKEPLVAGYEVKSEADRWLVEVRLRAVPTDLPTFYRHLEQKIGEAMGRRPFALQLTDQRDKTLEEVYYRSQFPIYQALAQGCFTDMAREVERYAAESGAQARIYLDDRNLYLTLSHQDHFLVAVIPRAAVKEGGQRVL